MLYWYQDKSSVIYWYDNIWQPAPTMSKCYKYGCLSVIKDQFVLAVGGVYIGSKRKPIEMLDVSLKSPRWIPMMDMLVNRKFFGVGSLDNCVYVVSHTNMLHIIYVINLYVILINRLVDVMKRIVY